MLIDKSNIEKYIPQREPFIMISALISANKSGFSSSFVVEPNNLLLIDNVLSESALAENVAQTCAAGFGYLASLEKDEDAKIGFIGAITKMEILGEVSVHSKIETEVNILNTFETIHLVEGVVKFNGDALMKCQMKIVLA